MSDDIDFDPTIEHFAVTDRPWIGIHLSVSDKPNKSYVFAEKPLIGPVVLKVIQNGPAHQAGIKAGDMIVQIDHSPVTSPEAFIECLQNREIGTVMIVGINREDHVLQLKVQIARDPEHQRLLHDAGA